MRNSELVLTVFIMGSLPAYGGKKWNVFTYLGLHFGDVDASFISSFLGISWVMGSRFGIIVGSYPIRNAYII